MTKDIVYHWTIPLLDRDELVTLPVTIKGELRNRFWRRPRVHIKSVTTKEAPIKIELSAKTLEELEATIARALGLTP